MPIQQKVWNIGALVGLMLALYLIALTIWQFKSIGYVGTSPDQKNSITINGTGDAYAVPDVATFSFTVTDTEKTIADAQKKATDEVNAALAVVHAAGVAQNDIQTQYYSINPHYVYQNAVCQTQVYSSASSGGTVSSGSGVMIPTIAPAPATVATPAMPVYCPPGKQTLTGYDVSESVSVKLRDLTKAGSLLTSLGSAGVDNLNGPSFEVDNPDAVQSQARSKAIADAKSKANELANELGVTLGKVMSFSDNNGGYPVPMMYSAKASLGATDSAVATPPEVPTGQQKITDNVSITYEIR